MAEDKENLDFSKYTKKLGKIEDIAQVNDIASSIADAYLNKAEYKDKKGVKKYKTKFTVDEAEKLGDDIFDQLVYHAHRRHFNIDKQKYEGLLNIEDDEGYKYVDTIVEHEFRIDRESLKRMLKDLADRDAKITNKVLEELLGKHINNYVQHIKGRIVKDINPEHMDSLKKHIEGLVERHKLPKKKHDVSGIYDFDQLMAEYIGIAEKYYSEDEEAEKKKAA